MTTQRNSNCELLRIVAILMVITLHYFNENIGGVLGIIQPNSINDYVSKLLMSICIVAVNLFVLTSAYFNTYKTTVDFKKLLGLIGLTWFYGAFLYITSVLYKEQVFNWHELINSMNIFLQGGYWYIKVYIILMIITPYLNTVHQQIDQKQHIKLILILLISFSIWPSFFPGAPSIDNGYGIISFVVLYFIGCYIRKYSVPRAINKYSIYIYIGCVIVTYLYILKGGATGWNYNFLFNILGAVALIITFLKFEIRSRIINYMATFTLAIYIIHFNPYIINMVYHKILRCKEFANSVYLIPHILISIIAIGICCGILEYLRR